MTWLLVWILNAVTLLIVAYVLPGITVASFWSAVGGAILYSIISWALSTLLLSKNDGNP
jgi:putative membrane protein